MQSLGPEATLVFEVQWDKEKMKKKRRLNSRRRISMPCFTGIDKKKEKRKREKAQLGYVGGRNTHLIFKKKKKKRPTADLPPVPYLKTSSARKTHFFFPSP